MGGSDNLSGVGGKEICVSFSCLLPFKFEVHGVLSGNGNT